MEIDEILDKWFDVTFKMYQEKVHPPRQIDLLMMGVLRYSRHCSVTIFLLLSQQAKLSTMVLLRSYLELYLKFCWCLINDSTSQKSYQDSVYDRFKRWDYKRLLEDRKRINKLLEITNDEYRLEICKAQKKAEDCIIEYKKQKLKCLPDIWQILKELSDSKQFQNYQEVILKVYPDLYQKFNKAVHPDMEFIRKMVINTGNTYVCNCDVSENIKELRLYLISMSCDINKMIRNFYSWDSAEIQNEYNLIVKQLNC
ncbi:MAG: hypothetical protein JW787_15680 [Sedimentisphaerales bacterium]|nr:hypothetical protein [Sedimentisphaerales bacterium]